MKNKKIIKVIIIGVLTAIFLYFVVGFIFLKFGDYSRLENLDLDGDIITITEEEYLNYLDELYINSKKYIGKQVIIEGYYDYFNEDEIRYHFVGREIKTHDHDHDEECDEQTHVAGLEFMCDEAILLAAGDFIRVEGTLGSIQEQGRLYLILQNCSIETVMT